jgi:hypothetical protein
MVFKKLNLYILMATLVLCISCLYSRTGASPITVHRSIKINYGNAILKINGQINENLYTARPNERLNDPIKYYDNPIITEGTITKNETKYLSTGEVYAFSVLPTEVVTINITSLDNNDVEITVFEYGQEKIYTLNGSNRLGLNIAFQNR